MTSVTKLPINIAEDFQHLTRAPIVEAVIDIRARPSVKLEEAALKRQLETKLGNYQFLDSLQHFEIRHEVSLQGDKPAAPIISEQGWKGLRFQSADKKNIAQFNRDGFIFSRLEPYQNWQQLHSEARSLWQKYIEIAQPIEIHRIGLRYVNRIQLPAEELRFENYLELPPATPKNLDVPFYGFLYQDTLAVPGHPYAINVIRTIQSPGGMDARGLSLILDIDAFTTQEFEWDETLLERLLPELRWLKNKVFFGSLTANAMKLFQ